MPVVSDDYWAIELNDIIFSDDSEHYISIKSYSDTKSLDSK